MPRPHSSKKKMQAIQLRQKGNSLRAIAKITGVSLSTIQLWTREVLLSEEQKNNIAMNHQQKLRLGQKKFNDQRKIEKTKKEQAIFQKAKNEVKDRIADSFFILGLSLYWAEGFKKDHSLGFVNSDPEMICLFLKWLTQFGEFNSKDIHPRVQIHEVYKPHIQSIQLYESVQFLV